MTKQEFDKKYVGEKKAVHCPTEELANEFLKEAHKHGYQSIFGDSYLELNYWQKCKKETCYKLFNGTYTYTDYYKKHNYEIIEFKGFEKSYMEQLAKIFNVEIGERFEIEGDNYNPYHFEEDGLYDVEDDNRLSMLSQILREKVKIKKLPKQWKPKMGERYWTFRLDRKNGGIEIYEWTNHIIDNALFKNNAIFKTKEEAESAYQAMLKTLEKIKESKK